MIKKTYNMDTCPACGSHNIERDDPEFDSLSMWHGCICADCGQQFLEIYPFESPYIEYEEDEDDSNM